MSRTPLSMLVLSMRLRRQGFAPHHLGYWCAIESFERIVRRTVRRLEQIATRRYIVVGHSLGGLVARIAVASLPAATRRPDRLFMLGTPNRASMLAARFASQWWYRAWHGDCGVLLGDERRMQELPVPNVPITIIAGSRGLPGGHGPFGSLVNDTIVSVDETRLAGAELLVLPVQHTTMMNNSAVADLIAGRE